MGTESASSSSSLTPQWTFDAFLSFRGEDTRNGFTDHLYAALKQKGIITFKDDEKLERGKSISPKLLKAIEESRFAIVILSSNYASSTWCLDELAKINKCRKETRLTILPIFYHVNPSDVRKQTGTFAQAFDKHKNENIEKVQTWRAALKEVADLSGWHLQDGPESKVIQNIVRELWENLRYPYLKDVQDKVGIISRAKELESCLAMGVNDVRIIGVWGMGGMGKTTLARVVFHMVSNKFEGCCFLANVREVFEKKGLVQLQERLILEILNESMSIQDDCDGVFVIKNRLRNRRILLVLDDVNELEQLNKLAGKHIWFGSGSRVIITTRYKQLLEAIGVDEIYEAKGLSNDESLHFLSLKAFKKDHPPKDYLNLSKDFVHYANGLPLAVEVLGSFLINRSINQWKGTLNRLKQFPESNILEILKISLEGLHETENEIFLNIACFFNHEDKDSVEEKLHVLGLYPEIGLRVLIDKSLIKLLGNQLWMHDLIQDMGRDIVRQEGPKNPGKRSRLWLYEDIDNVLTEDTGTEAVEGIILNLSEPKRANWNPKAFSKLYNLKMLEISNIHLLQGPIFLPNSLRLLDWTDYPSKSLPSSFYPQQLVELRMACSKIERLWKGVKYLDKLKLIQVNNSQNLIETPDIAEISNLERLVFKDCINLHCLHPSIGVHKSLTILNLEGCVNLRTLPKKFEMDSLKVLNLSGCSKLKEIPEFGENMQHVVKLYLDGTAITKLPTSIGHVTNLALLNLRDCKRIICLPSTIFNLKFLKSINLSGCSKLERLPENVGNAEMIEELDVSGTAVREVPSSIGSLINLKVLSFKRCKGLSSFQSTSWFDLLPFCSRPRISTPRGLSSLSSLCSLTYLNLGYCSLKEVPDDISSFFCLEEIDLSGNNFVYLPESIIQLFNLEVIYLENCTSLLTLPMFPSKINYIWASNCTSLAKLPDKLKPKDSFEPSLHLVNCLNLADNQGLIDLLFALLNALLQGLPHQYPLGRYNLVIPGSIIPKWFSHQSIGDEVGVQKKNSLRNGWIGIAVCILFCSNNDHPRDQIINLGELGCHLIANGNRIYPLPGISNIAKVLSDHIWLLYLFPQHYDRRSINLLWECDVNGFNEIGIRIETNGSGLRVKKCGFRLVYMEDIEDLHRTMVQSINNSECTSVSFGIQETHDGAGPSEEDSFNGISDCEESSEYEDCGEEFRDSD